MDVGEDEEAGVAGDQVQPGLAGGGVPAEVGVAGGAFPGRGGEAERGDGPGSLGLDLVAQLGSGQRGVAEVVVGGDEVDVAL